MFITIGKLAKKAHVTVETIRYYQRKGLLIEPEKPVNGYRQYPIDDITRIRFIKHAQQCGFTLNEISELLFMDSGHCQDVQKMAEQKSQQINQQIKDLIALQNVLDSVVEGCQESQSTESCSFIDALFRQSQQPESSNK
ncbi:MAG: MerR family transcriptional regulator [Gammaproteobacteria bacterium]|nr:MerR family transcriptional regulator [Gammaproteobacteria bacterium]